MAFCKDCGADLNGARFCPNCGASANGGSAIPTIADARLQCLTEMQHMHSYFEVKQKQYDDYETVTQKVERLQAKTNLGWLIAFIGITLGYCLLAKSLSYLGTGLILGAPFLIVYILLRANNKKKLGVALKKQEKLLKELKEHYAAYGPCSLGFKYSNPKILGLLHDIVDDGRATNTVDAINTFKDDMHKYVMEQEAKETRLAAQRTADNAEIAARSARKAAGYASATFWFK